MAILTAGGSPSEVERLLDTIRQPSPKVILYFFSPDLGNSSMHRSIQSAFPGAHTVGCSMIGGWGPHGPQEDGVVLMSLGSEEVEAVTVAMSTGMKSDPVAAADSLLSSLRSELDIDSLSPARHVGILMVDGLGLGERVVRKLSEALPIPLIGGAAADHLEFSETYVTADGRTSGDGAVLAVLKLRVPFFYGHYVHYRPTDSEFVITEADPDARTVWTINGEPAAGYYAKLIGLSGPEAIEVGHFSTNPLGVVIGDQVYVRSPNQVVDGRGLRFYCYIEAGTRMRLLTQGDIIRNAEGALQDAREHLGQVDAALLFNCVLRYLEMKASPGLLKRFADVFESSKTVGVNTYGEELFTHHNQTLTALFLGSRSA